MIRHLMLKDVGPARELKFDFAPRLNVLTGDNGLGKTFVLDALWWVLTTTWAGERAFPWRPPSPDPGGGGGSGDGSGSGDGGGSGDGSGYGERGEIRPAITSRISILDEAARQDKALVTEGSWQWVSQEWWRKPWRHWRSELFSDLAEESIDEARIRPPALVVYARIDGSFALWDSYQVKGGVDDFGEAAIVMDSSELWHGKKASAHGSGRPRTISRGLLEDWVSWQGTGAPEFQALCRALKCLSEPDEPLVPGRPTRVRLDDRLDIPTLSLSYGEVPVTLASAGVKRILGLAYALVWAWTEHVKAAKLTQRAPASDMVVLIDEVELHLHPKWQRMLLPAILKAIDGFGAHICAQLFVTTHSPLVLASLESVFREAMDDLFVLERGDRAVLVNAVPFGKEGDVSNWLSSDVFDRVGGRSREAELAIGAAMDFMADRAQEAERHLNDLALRLAELPGDRSADDLINPNDALGQRIHDALKRTLPGHDDFWPQWTLAWRPKRVAH